MKHNDKWARTPYGEKLRDPRWQKMRLEVMQRDEFACQFCGDSTKTLNVHHLYYVSGRDPWDYPPAALVTLCEPCHEEESAALPSAMTRCADAMRRAGFASQEFDRLAAAIGRLPEVDVERRGETWRVFLFAIEEAVRMRCDDGQEWAAMRGRLHEHLIERTEKLFGDEP